MPPAGSSNRITCGSAISTKANSNNFFCPYDKLAAGMSFNGGETNEIEQFQRAFLFMRGTPAAEQGSGAFTLCGDVHVLHNRESWKNAGQLKGSANTQSEHIVWFRIGDRVAAKSNGTGIDLFIAGDDIKEGGFSRSIGTDQPGDTALLHAEGAGVEGLYASKGLRDVLYF